MHVSRQPLLDLSLPHGVNPCGQMAPRGADALVTVRGSTNGVGCTVRRSQTNSRCLRAPPAVALGWPHRRLRHAGSWNVSARVLAARTGEPTGLSFLDASASHHEVRRLIDATARVSARLAVTIQQVGALGGHRERLPGLAGTRPGVERGGWVVGDDEALDQFEDRPGPKVMARSVAARPPRSCGPRLESGHPLLVRARQRVPEHSAFIIEAPIGAVHPAVA